MTVFAYNNSVHVNTGKISHELLKDYITNFVNAFKNKVLKRKTFLIIKRIN